MQVSFFTKKGYETFCKKNKKKIFRAVQFSHSLDNSQKMVSKASIIPLSETDYEVWHSKEDVQRNRNNKGDHSSSVEGLVYARFETPHRDDHLDDLVGAAYGLYERIFEFGKTHDLHIARIWNYIPNILDESGNLERYRHFNIGRHRCWEDNGPKDEKGNLIVPAASGIGALGGALKIGVLYCKDKPVHIQNTRQISPKSYSLKFGPKPPMFSRATYVKGVGLFVSGTASIVGEDTKFFEDPIEQTQESMRNIAHLISPQNLKHHGLEDLGFKLSDITDWRLYIKHAHQAALIETIFSSNKINKESGHILLRDDICRDNLLVEIEGTIFEE